MSVMTERGLQTLTRSHRVAGRIRASVNGSSFIVPVQFDTATVTVDGSSPMRRTLDAVVRAAPDDPVVDTLAAEWRAEYGLVLQDGTVEWVTVGTFVVTDAVEEGRGVMRVTAKDRWLRVVEARFVVPTFTGGGIPYAIGQLLQQADDRITFRDESGSSHGHRRSVHERDRDKAVLDLARAIGCEVFFDPEGVAVLRPVPSFDQPATWRVVGGDGGAIVRARRGQTRERTYNAFVAMGEQIDGALPVRSMAMDNDPRSPTYYGGPFGKKPRFLVSGMITSTAQAQAAANAGLRRYLGVARSLSVDAVPHPGLEPGALIHVEVAPGAYERHLLDGYALPLGPGGVTYSTRAAALVVEEEGEQ